MKDIKNIEMTRVAPPPPAVAMPPKPIDTQLVNNLQCN